ncbi:hypothetical protein DIPPA_12477 [Diplonema papillatum]|nr:hypothetical protein DIPPA_12477 [Diplonema papillatum]
MVALSVASQKNADISFEDSKLIVKVDLTKTFGDSGTGRSITVSGAHGLIGSSNLRLGLNVYIEKRNERPFKAEEAKGFEQSDKMKNVHLSVSGSTLTYVVNLAVEPEDVDEKKSLMIASSLGRKKVGKSSVWADINVTMAKGKTANLAGLGVTNEGLNLKIVPKPGDAKTMVLQVDSSKAAAKGASGKYLLATSSGALEVGGKRYNVNLISPGPEASIPEQKEEVPVNAKAKGVTYTHVGNELRFYVDTTGEYGESESGVSNTVATSSGKITGSTLSAGINVYVPSGKKAAVKAAGGSKEPTYAEVKKAVNAHLDDADEDAEITVGSVRRALVSEHGWKETEMLKTMVKKAIKASEDDGEDEAPPAKKKKTA